MQMSKRSRLWPVAIIMLLLAITNYARIYASGLRARQIYASDDESIPHSRSKIGKVTMLYGATRESYERSLKLHEAHDNLHGYTNFVLREQLLEGFWSKPAYILSLLMSEMAKPPGDRLEWLFWYDGDIVLMNHKIPLEIFLPPPEFSHVNCLVTNDHRGLNNGAFFLRVNSWSVLFMSANLGWKIYRPEVHLPFNDQSAMGMLLEENEWRNETMHVPQRWFNAFAGYRDQGIHEEQTRFRQNSVNEGDLLVHFAGNKKLRDERMIPWIEMAEEHLPKWEKDLEETEYIQEIREFWTASAADETRRVDGMIAKRIKDAQKSP